MLSKIFFVLMLLIFGGLLFTAGVLAPESVKTPTANVAHKAMAALPFVSTARNSDTKPTNEEKKAPTAPPVPAESLLLPTPLPPQGQYALQIGQFGSTESADVLLKRAQSAGVVANKIAAVDRSGQTWWIVAVGNYAQPEEARTARITIAREISALEEMPVILLPAASGVTVAPTSVTAAPSVPASTAALSPPK